MINKVEIAKSFDRYKATYTVMDSKDFIDILRECKNSISYIRIHEDTDISLSSYGGTYTFDELEEKFDLNYPYFDEMYVYFKTDDTCFIYKSFENKLEVITQDLNFDLETYISEKKSKMIL